MYVGCGRKENESNKTLARCEPSTLNPAPCTLNPQPCTRNPQPSTLNPQPSTLNPQPSTHHPESRSRRGARHRRARRARSRGSAGCLRSPAQTRQGGVSYERGTPVRVGGYGLGANGQGLRVAGCLRSPLAISPQSVQGHLAHKKTPSPRTLLLDYA